MATNQSSVPKSDLPKLAAPALRALAGVGITRLDQLTQFTEVEIKKLHGVGPNALIQLGRALEERGLTFAADSSLDGSST